jgi:hypothetical protein
MNKKISSLLLLSLLTSTESFADHQSSDSSDSSDNLVESVEKYIAFNFVMTNISYESNFTGEGDTLFADGYDQAADPIINNYLLATFDITFLPNTWKINLGYTGQVGKDVFYESASRSENITPYGHDEGESEVEYISFYTKPLETSFGDFGIGYRSMTQPNGVESGGIEIVDLPSLSTKSARFKTKTKYAYLTYNIPAKNKWYSGLGVTYSMGESNLPMLSADINNIVIKPDTDISQIEVGINKTLDEVNTGLSFKTLTLGLKTLDSSYFNYKTNKKESVSRDFELIHLDLIYMFKAKKQRQLYTSFRVLFSAGEFEEYDEIELNLGVTF